MRVDARSIEQGGEREGGGEGGGCNGSEILVRLVAMGIEICVRVVFEQAVRVYGMDIEQFVRVGAEARHQLSGCIIEGVYGLPSQHRDARPAPLGKCAEKASRAGSHNR